MEKKVVNKYGDGVAWIRGAMLGKGSSGCVYLATLKNPRSKYSYLPPIIAVKSAEVSNSGSIQKEKEVLNNVKDCSSVIQCFGEETTIGDDGVMVYNLLLEYGCGGNLTDRINNNRNNGGTGIGLSEYEVKVYTKSILKGLNHIHEIGYVHCDLKPENILLLRNSGKGSIEFRAKIGDFGLAKKGKQNKKKRKLEPFWCGTPMYLSPEAVIEGVQEAPSDIWALGCIVLEMLSGKRPWGGEEEMNNEDILKIIGENRELPKIPSDLSNDAKSFLKGCFVKNPMFRLTAEMLLMHPFVEGLVEESEEVEDILLVTESDDELDWYDESDEDSFFYWSEEDAEDIENETLSKELRYDNAIKSSIQVTPQVF